MLFFAGMERKVGKVRVHARDRQWRARLEAVQQGCVVMRCEYRPVDDAFHMDLYCKDFEPIEAHTVPPQYEAVLEETAEGIVRKGFRKL